MLLGLYCSFIKISLEYAPNSKFLLLSLLFIKKIIFPPLSSTASNFYFHKIRKERRKRRKRRKGEERQWEKEEGEGRRREGRGGEREDMLYSYLDFIDLC